MQVIWLFAMGTGVSLLFMFSLWVLYLFRRNAGLIDIGWACAFLLTLAVSIIWGVASLLRLLLLSMMVIPWSLRLAWHLWDRFDWKVEDRRYTQIRKNWGGDPSGFKFIKMFMLQGVLVALVSVPFFIAGSDTSTQISYLSVIGLFLAVAALIGETVADFQLRQFKKNPGNRDRICDVGLWSLSRHPNYFFEWLVWVGIGIFSLSAMYGWVGLISPLIMYGLLRHVSGVPMLEKQMHENPKKGWREYQNKVPIFFPRLW